MATMKDFEGWIERDLSRFGETRNHVERVNSEGSKDGDEYEYKEKIRLYTETNSYSIVAVEHSNDTGYLGCQASSRKPRAGEDWTRGRDLPDGPLNEETWHEILGAIVSYEMVKVHKPPVAHGGPLGATELVEHAI